MCLDPYTRVLHTASLETWSTEFASDGDALVLESNTTTIEEKKAVIDASVTTTNWMATVACDGCPDYEPLFEPAKSDKTSSADAENGRATDTRRERRRMRADLLCSLEYQNREFNERAMRRLQVMSLGSGAQFSLEDFFGLFAATFGWNVEPVLSGRLTTDAFGSTLYLQPPTDSSGGEYSLEIVYANTKSGSDTDGSDDTVVSVLGVEEIREYLEAVEENNGTIVTPFVSNELVAFEASVENCLDAEVAVDSDFCDIVQSSNPQIVAQCLENSKTLECQELLPGLLDALDEAVESGDPAAVAPISIDTEPNSDEVSNGSNNEGATSDSNLDSTNGLNDEGNSDQADGADFGTPSSITPGVATPDSTNPGSSTPGAATPEATTPDVNTPGVAAPGASTSKETIPGSTAPGEITPDDTALDPATPDTSVNSSPGATASNKPVLPGTTVAPATGGGPSVRPAVAPGAPIVKPAPSATRSPTTAGPAIKPTVNPGIPFAGPAVSLGAPVGGPIIEGPTVAPGSPSVGRTVSPGAPSGGSATAAPGTTVDSTQGPGTAGPTPSQSFPPTLDPTLPPTPQPVAIVTPSPTPDPTLDRKSVV